MITSMYCDHQFYNQLFYKPERYFNTNFVSMNIFLIGGFLIAPSD